LLRCSIPCCNAKITDSIRALRFFSNRKISAFHPKRFLYGNNLLFSTRFLQFEQAQNGIGEDRLRAGLRQSRQVA